MCLCLICFTVASVQSSNRTICKKRTQIWRRYISGIYWVETAWKWIKLHSVIPVIGHRYLQRYTRYIAGIVLGFFFNCKLLHGLISKHYIEFLLSQQTIIHKIDIEISGLLFNINTRMIFIFEFVWLPPPYSRESGTSPRLRQQQVLFPNPNLKMSSKGKSSLSDACS